MVAMTAECCWVEARRKSDPVKWDGKKTDPVEVIEMKMPWQEGRRRHKRSRGKFPSWAPDS